MQAFKADKMYNMKVITLFSKVKVIQALAFLLIPLVLYLLNGDLLSSISAYVNYTPVAFTFMLTLAACLFIYDGLTTEERWYNIYIGASLFGVITLNHLDYPILHYTFAVVFFIGSLVNMVAFSSTSERLLKFLTAIAVLFGMSGCFIFNWYSIYWAEWIGMVPISAHFILEELGKID